jgi:hypothetical protein
MDPGVAVKFQLVFFESSSRMLVNYADTIMGGSCATSDRGGSATVGVQVGASAGTQRSFNAAVIDGNTSELWTTIVPFTDESLSGVDMKAIHIVELRDRINVVRVAHGLPPFTWTDPSPTAGTTFVRAAHIQELRAALAAAFIAAGRTPPLYTDPSIDAGVTTIKAVHITELRAAIVAIE